MHLYFHETSTDGAGGVGGHGDVTAAEQPGLLGADGGPRKTRLAGITSFSSIGDCNNPSTIATAIYDGHRAARELDAVPTDPDMPFRRERIALSSSV